MPGASLQKPNMHKTKAQRSTPSSRLTSYRKPMLLPLKMAKRRLNTEKKLFWNGVTDVLHQPVTNQVTSMPFFVDTPGSSARNAKSS
jgi:hypothetical protein